MKETYNKWESVHPGPMGGTVRRVSEISQGGKVKRKGVKKRKAKAIKNYGGLKLAPYKGP